MPRYKIRLSAIEKYIGWYQIEIDAENKTVAGSMAIDDFAETEFQDNEFVEVDIDSIEICDITEVLKK